MLFRARVTNLCMTEQREREAEMGSKPENFHEVGRGNSKGGGISERLLKASSLFLFTQYFLP